MTDPATEFRSFAKERGIEIDRIVHVHPGKGRIVAVTARAGRPYSLVKWNVPGGEHQAKLLREIAFYSTPSTLHRFTPELVDHGKNFLEIEYIEAIPLRRWLIDRRDSGNAPLRMIESYVAVLNALAAGRGPSVAPVDDARDLASYLSKLFSSGPMDAPDYPANRRIAGLYRNHFCSRARRRIRRALETIAQDPHRAVGHRDFHLNNILYTRDGRLQVVDWENAGPSSIFVDALYSHAMLSHLLLSTAERDVLSSGMKRWEPLKTPNISHAFDQLLPLFSATVASNPRFHDRMRPFTVARAHLSLAFGRGI